MSLRPPKRQSDNMNEPIIGVEIEEPMDTGEPPVAYMRSTSFLAGVNTGIFDTLSCEHRLLGLHETRLYKGVNSDKDQKRPPRIYIVEGNCGSHADGAKRFIKNTLVVAQKEHAQVHHKDVEIKVTAEPTID